MKLITWNVNSVKQRLPRLEELLELHQPDVVCLQETKAQAEAFPHQAFAAAGYQAVDYSAGRWAGVAILAKTSSQVSGVSTGLFGEAAPDEARWIEADVDGVRVASVYVPNGREIGTDPFHQKLVFLERMRDWVADRTDEPVAVAGDVNVCRTDLDVWDPQLFIGATHVTGEERERLEAVLDAGLVDVFRQRHPDEPGYTWWDYRAGAFHRGWGQRIDLVMASPELAAGDGFVGTDREFRKGPKPSDHAPLIAELTRP